MSRKALFILAVAALVFASAMTMFCVSDECPSDAASEYICVPAEPNPGSHGPGHDDMGMRAGPGPMGVQAPNGPSRYVIDVPDRPDPRPDRIIDDYGRMYNEKRALEEDGAEVFIHDPGLERDAGKELADAINAVFDGAIVPVMPKGAEVIAPSQSAEKCDVSFLELLLDEIDDGSWLRELLLVMISQYVSAESESEGVAPSTGRENDIPEISPEIIKDGDDSNVPVIFVDNIPEHIPSSESYLEEHGFDGGTTF